jgi:Polyketide cyclase / dehydrase and lipid transport
MLTHRHETSAMIGASMAQVFAYVDDHARLSSHMSESSWMMGGGRMQIEVDEGRGQEVGSRIRLAGRIFGVQISVEERVIERIPPRRKVWETTGSPQLVVIEHYRMGIDISPQGKDSTLRVFIEYSLPAKVPARWLGILFGRYYARWCTRRMTDDAVKHFESFASVPAH